MSLVGCVSVCSLPLNTKLSDFLEIHTEVFMSDMILCVGFNPKPLEGRWSVGIRKKYGASWCVENC